MDGCVGIFQEWEREREKAQESQASRNSEGREVRLLWVWTLEGMMLLC